MRRERKKLSENELNKGDVMKDKKTLREFLVKHKNKIIVGSLVILSLTTILLFDNGHKKVDNNIRVETGKEEKNALGRKKEKESKEEAKTKSSETQKLSTKQTVEKDGTVVIESKDEQGNTVVTRVKGNQVEKIITDKAGRKRVEKSKITDKENSDLKAKVEETQREMAKETSTKKETQKEVVKKATQSKPKETSKEVSSYTKSEPTITYETVAGETETIPYKTLRKHNISGADTRVSQSGVNGVKTNYYKVKYSDGEEVSREFSYSETTKSPVDEVIQTYVKVQDRVVEEREVEDKSRPIYDWYGRERWFVKNDATGEITYHYSAKEADEKYGENLDKGQLSSWGTAETEIITTDEILGYEYKTEEVVVQEEKWEWQ